MRRVIIRRYGRAHNGDARIADLVMAGMFLILILLGSLVSLTLYQQSKIRDQQHEINRAQGRITKNQFALQSQQRQLSFVEERDRINSYQTAYRFCTRINIDRAVLHWFASASGQPNAATRSYLRRLERKDGAPILDCEPNIKGGPAAYLPRAAQRKFVRRWSKHQLTAPEIGICKIPIGKIRDPKACAR